MELQAQLTALEEEMGMLKGEIKAILQEVRVAVLARQNPFLADDFDRSGLTVASLSGVDGAPGTPPTMIPAQALEAVPVVEPTPRAVHAVHPEHAEDIGLPVAEATMPMRTRRPVDLAALMVWVQECAETFSHTEFVMLVTMASYADYFDDGLKQALLDMSQQVEREHAEKASLSDFSLALKQLESIRATSGHRRTAA